MPEASKEVAERPDFKTRFSADRQPATRGRPRVWRERLTNSFLESMCADFTKHGVAAIERVRTEEPAQYLRIAASLVPKEIEFLRPLAELDDDKLAAVLEILMAMRLPENAKEVAAELLND